jgi:hypothetical protein
MPNCGELEPQSHSVTHNMSITSLITGARGSCPCQYFQVAKACQPAVVLVMAAYSLQNPTISLSNKVKGMRVDDTVKHD